VQEPCELRGALERALASGKPACVVIFIGKDHWGDCVWLD